MTDFVDVVIVGAGISGISAAWHLQDRCPNKSYVVLERRENLGGTWDLFKYPGIRSDSDMFTLGFRFKPWTSEKAIADGPSIMSYLKETVAEYGIDKHIRYGQKVVGADWSDAENRWTLRVQRDGEEVEIKASFLFACSGYYNYDQGYSPEFAGSEDFAGHDHSPAALAGGAGLRGQEDRGHRQWCHRGDIDSGPCQFGCGPRHDAAAIADLHRLAARRRPVHRPDEQDAARPSLPTSSTGGRASCSSPRSTRSAGASRSSCARH